MVVKDESRTRACHAVHRTISEITVNSTTKESDVRGTQSMDSYHMSWRSSVAKRRSWKVGGDHESKLDDQMVKHDLRTNEANEGGVQVMKDKVCREPINESQAGVDMLLVYKWCCKQVMKVL